MADKGTISLMFALAASRRCILEHFDIHCAFVHEHYPSTYPVLVIQPPRFDGSFKYRDRVGRLRQNLCGTRAAGHIYLQGLFQLLKSLGYHLSEADQCLFIFKAKTTPSYIFVFMDDFLILAPNRSSIHAYIHSTQTWTNVNSQAPRVTSNIPWLECNPYK